MKNYSLFEQENKSKYKSVKGTCTEGRLCIKMTKQDGDKIVIKRMIDSEGDYFALNSMIAKKVYKVHQLWEL